MTPTEHIQHHQLAIVYWAAQKQGTPFDVQYQFPATGAWVTWCDKVVPLFALGYHWRRKPKEPRRLLLIREDPSYKWTEWPYYIAINDPSVEKMEVIEVMKEKT